MKEWLDYEVREKTVYPDNPSEINISLGQVGGSQG